MRKNHTCALLLLASISTSGCTGGDFAGQDLAQGGKEKQKGSSESEEGEDKEDDPADSPTEVAGAFLTGRCGEVEAESMVSAATVALGCVVLKAKTLEKIPDLAVNSVEITFDDGTTEKPPFDGADSADPWHVHFGVESTKYPHLKSVKLTWDDSLEGALDITVDHSESETPLHPAEVKTKVISYAFVTKNLYKPSHDFASLAKADEICLGLASSEAVLKKATKWTALITTADQDIKKRWQETGPVHDANDQEIAASDTDFWDKWAQKKALFDLNEKGQTVGLGQAFWTGIGKSADVDPAQIDCKGWTSSSLFHKGVVEGRRSPGDLSPFESAPCHEGRHLYCIGH